MNRVVSEINACFNAASCHQREIAMAKPFHESVVDILAQVGITLGNNSRSLAVGILATLIRKTKIPKNHDAIANALRAQADSESPNQDILRALAHIESEKERCEMEAQAKAKENQITQ